MKKDLSSLLKEVDALFVHSNRESRLCSCDYALSRFPYGWTFTLINSWHKWIDADLDHHFSVWEDPEDAVQEFLDYVKDNDIDVGKLMDTE